MRVHTERDEPEGRPDAPRVSFWTFGCRLNQHDTAAMHVSLEAIGWRRVPEGADADVAVVNTCTVTARADQEARQLIRRIARERPGTRIVATGCYAQRAPEELRALPGVAAVLGTAERDRIAEHLGPGIAGLHVAPARAKRPLAPSSPVAFGRARALLKVQDGCDSFCAYCVVPYVRGRTRSLPLEEALAQGRRLLDAGFAEIVVTGADLGAYGGPGRARLGRLVRELLALGPAHRVRLSSIEPNKLDPEVLALLGREPRLCRHLHLPLQSGSDAVLRAMRRPYRARDFAALVERIAARGTIGIGTDVIVGFAGEGEREFEETRSLLRDLPISFVHVFRYSPRPGTVAARSTEPGVPAAAARERSDRLRVLGEEKRAAFFRSLIGRTLPAVSESPRESGLLTARTDVYAPVQVPGARPWRGIADVRITDADRDRCLGALARGSAAAIR